LTAELQEKFETSQTKTLDFEMQIKNNEVKIKTLQDRLLEFKAEKANFDSQLGQLKSRNAELSSDLKESKGVKERVAELESAVAIREKTLTQSEQKIKDLTVALEQGKKSREQLKNELSTKADRITELEQRLAATLSSRAELKNDVELGERKIAEFQQQLQTSQANQQMLQATIEKSEKEIVELKNRLKGFEAQQIPAEPSPGVAEMPKKTAPPRDVVKDQGIPPNPSDIIDWVLKKKAK
jgi:chromosome segregation ATPase